MTRIVLTGGSCSGKTHLCSRLGTRLGDGAIVLSESATDVFLRHGISQFDVDDQTRRVLQREIYRTQIAREQNASVSGCGVMLADRGTVDCAAYWPDGPSAFWPEMGTSHESECSRYDLAIWLETAAVIGRYERRHSGYEREDDQSAVALGERILELWRPHANLVIVRATDSIEQKEEAVLNLLSNVARFRR